MLKIINPATETVIEELQEDTPASVARKFEQARVRHKGWAATPLDDRLRAIAQFGALLSQNRERLAELLTREMGKPIQQARNEISSVLGRIDFFLTRTPQVLHEEEVHLDDSIQETIRQESLGVIANISAWNYPYFVGANVFIPALLSGNTVLYKPSEYATLTGLAIADLLWEAGVPTDAFIPVIGGAEVGEELLRQPVEGVFFTGSHATGSRISQALSGRLIRTQFELGGKDPVYVSADVDVEQVAEAVADGAFYNCGQSCCAVERVYVDSDIHDDFLDAFVSTVERFKIGDPMKEETYIGPLARAAQLPLLDRQVQQAMGRGGRIMIGGERLDRPGYYFKPTVVANANHSMHVMMEESFGPIIGIQRVSSEDEAVSLMRDTPYGLTAGVYTKDRDRADRVLSQLDVGSAYWNCCDRVSPRLPWSGRRASGMGSTLSRLGIQAFVQPKAWHWKFVSQRGSSL